MSALNAFLRGLVIFVAISVIQVIAGIIIPIKNISVPAHTFEWLLLINAMTAAALVVLAVRTEWRGWRLGAALAVIPLAILSLNALEGSVFLKNSGLPWGRISLQAVVSAVLIVPVWMIVFGRREKATTEHYHPIQAKGRGERAWKFVVSDLTYLVLYYGAGMIIFPYVRDFYATQQLPSAGTIVALQLMIRGPVFVLICLGMTRMLGLSRIGGAIMVGLLFTVISGVAPLLMPNPVFPDAVRWVHFCEVVSENFVFGAIVAWLWGEPVVARLRELRQAA
jgi:hypothetical protein